MKKTSRINLPKDKKDEMIQAIKTYFDAERQEQLGDLASALILDFILEELAPEFYNQGILDAYRYINEKNEDMLSMLI